MNSVSSPGGLPGLSLIFLFILVNPTRGNFYILQWDNDKTIADQTLEIYRAFFEITLDWNSKLDELLGQAGELSKRLPIPFEEIFGRVHTIMDDNPEEGKIQRKGIFNALLHAYHSRPVDDEAFNESSLYYEALTLGEKACRESQGLIEEFGTSKCQYGYLLEKQEKWFNPVEKWTFANATKEMERIDKLIETLCLTDGSKFKWSAENFDKLLPITYNECLSIVLTQMDMMADFDRIRVNYRKAQPDFPQGVFSRMLKDTEESMAYIEENMEELENRLEEAKVASPQDDKVVQYWEERVKEFNAQLMAYPFNKLYAGGDLSILNDGRAALEQLKEATKDFRNYPYEEFKKNIGDFTSKMTQPEVEGRWTQMNQVWTSLLKVDLLKHQSGNDNGKDSGNLDPHFDFKFSNPLHKLRVGWDYLDKLSEGLKCHLRKSYWFDLRNETLQKTQMDLDKGRIFGHFSRTLYQTCRVNDTDILSRCNKANHEVCRPMIPSDRQEEYNTNTGDLSMYRPKWVYWRTVTDPNGVNAECDGQRTFIIPLNICRCGFILDCARDIGGELNCPLLPNDNIRKQCKGSIGYPCKSIPFAPGRHDASCVFGYCDMERNSCQEE